MVPKERNATSVWESGKMLGENTAWKHISTFPSPSF